MQTETDRGSDNELTLPYYSALLSGWIATRLEGDKSKLALSAGGIGLLMTLMTTGQALSLAQFVLYTAAVSCFTLTVGCVLVIFSRNATHVKDVLQGRATTDRVLRALDTASSLLFLLAVVLSMSIGVTHGLRSLSTPQEVAMPSEDERSGDFEILKKSLNGISELKPTKEQGEATTEQTSETAGGSSGNDDGEQS